MTCCEIPANLRSEPSGQGDLVLLRCVECKRRHFTLTLDPGIIGVTGTSLGG